MWGTQASGQELEGRLPSRPELTSFLPLSPAHVMLAAFSALEELTGRVPPYFFTC